MPGISCGKLENNHSHIMNAAMKAFLSEQKIISTFGEEHRTVHLSAPCWLFARVYLNNVSQLPTAR